MATDKIELESFVKDCKNLKGVFRKVAKQNLLIKVNEVNEAKLPNYGYMLPLRLFDDFALVRKVIHKDGSDVLSTNAILPYGSSIYYTIHKRLSDVIDVLK